MTYTVAQPSTLGLHEHVYFYDKCYFCKNAKSTLSTFISDFNNFKIKMCHSRNLSSISHVKSSYNTLDHSCKTNIKMSSHVNNNLSFGFYQNCRGLRTKLLTLKCNLASFNYVFIVLTETWLSSDVFDYELGFDNYNIYRCDRNNLMSICTRGGGVLIAVHKDFHSQIISITNLNIGQMYVSFYYNNEKFIVGGVYLPPNSPIQSYDSY